MNLAGEEKKFKEWTLECSYIYRSWDDEEQQKKKKKNTQLSKSTQKPRTPTRWVNILEAKWKQCVNKEVISWAKWCWKVNPIKDWEMTLGPRNNMGTVDLKNV